MPHPGFGEMDKGGMGHANPFGLPRRTGGVDDIGEVFRCRGRPGHDLRIMVGTILKIEVIKTEQVRIGGQLLFSRAIDQHHHRLGLGKDGGHAVGGMGRIDRRI